MNFNIKTDKPALNNILQALKNNGWKLSNLEIECVGVDFYLFVHPIKNKRIIVSDYKEHGFEVYHSRNKNDITGDIEKIENPE